MSTVHVRDPQALRALAHPLRLRLLSLLRLHGPSTATQLGQRVGESSGSTSYHLRELARYGFVEDAPELGTRRERWWRAAHATTSWEPDAFGADAADVVDELHRQLAAHRYRLVEAWQAQRHDLGPAWSGVGGLNDHSVRVTPEQARALSDELLAVLDRWAAAHPTDVPAEGTELVSVVVDVLPLAEWPQ